VAKLEESLERLRNYQRVGVQFLVAENGALLADEMGTGKTVQAACALETLRVRGQMRRALIVVPASLKLNWHRELKEWASGCSVRLLQGNKESRHAWYDLPINVLIASYEQVRADFAISPPETKFDVVILDEAQRVKGGNSTTVAVARINRDRTWALTGTPLENRVEELQTLIQLIRPGVQPGASPPEILDALQGHFLRRRKRDVLREMPPIVDQTQLLELTAAQSGAYDALWDDRRRMAGRDGSHLFALLTQLKQLCNYHPDSGESSKLEALAEIAEDVQLEGGKLLVFSQYVETLKWLGPQLPVPVSIYHGGLSAEERDLTLQQFADDEPGCALLVSLRAGGVGLNVPDATHVVLFDRWWNPQLEDQAVHRAHRFGREEPLLVTRFLTVGTVEERVVELLHEKRELFEEYVEGAAREAEATQDHLRTILGLEEER
jgi:SNF2 family DNA or RNA helicase